MKKYFCFFLGAFFYFQANADCETGLVSFSINDTIMSNKSIFIKNNYGQIYANIKKSQNENYIIEFYQPLTNFIDFEVYCSKLNDTTYLKNGLYIKYFKGANRIINIKGFYKDGCRNGKWVHYFENGNVSNRIVYHEDEYDGKWVSYYDNGNFRSIGSFKNGIENGKWKVFYENGGVKYKGKYSHELLPNSEKKNNDISNLDFVYPKNGRWIYYYENGNVERIEKFKKGVKNGVWKFFKKNGEFDKTEIYN